MTLSETVAKLTSAPDKEGYAAMKILQEESRHSPEVFSYWQDFAALLESKNAYQRNRGLVLLAANARWDKGNAVGDILPRYLTHIQDEKPITARQCIQNLPLLIQGQPRLAPQALAALAAADPTLYPSSMASLIKKDLAAAKEAIAGQRKKGLQNLSEFGMI